MLDIFSSPESSRLLLGSANYPSPEILQQAIKAAGSSIVTLSLRRQMITSKKKCFLAVIVFITSSLAA